VLPASIDDVKIFETKVFRDDRGSFFESFNSRTFANFTGQEHYFVQDNQSHSKKNVLRGLHYQIKQPQGKLVRVLKGEILDVAVDLRRSSKTFSRYVACKLSAEEGLAMWVPPGFAHGFLVLSETADVFYKTTDFWAHEHERSILWNDPDIGIEWGGDAHPVLSTKDLNATSFKNADLFD
jgi:dTDP-4-dehydrorhamnose 3,5-epimerase